MKENICVEKVKNKNKSKGKGGSKKVSPNKYWFCFWLLLSFILFFGLLNISYVDSYSLSFSVLRTEEINKK